MGCLFGYMGKPAMGLMESMAEMLGHRCALGWERQRLDLADGRTIEIGRGIPPWRAGAGPQVAAGQGGNTIVGFSGLIYNPPGALEDNAAHQSPGRRLLVALEREGNRLMERLDGAFVLAVGDPGKLQLLRDPSGGKVLYWTLTRERLLFAGEIKALFVDRLVPRKMRVAALPEYLTFSFVPGAGTMFEDIYELQPGSILTYAEGRPTVRRHFFFEDREFLPGGEPDENRHVHEVRAALEASVHAACSAMEEPPAVYLSGGIDSSAVLAVAANQHTGRRLKTFSVHFGSRYTNENAYVAMMVDRCHTDHTWLEIRPRGFVNEMRRIIWSLDDPIGDPITVPNYLLSQAAAEAAQWVLNGEGGDPCFGGPKNIPMMLSGLYGPGSADAGETWLEREYLRSFRKCYGDLRDLLDPGILRESGGVEALAAHIIPFLRADKPKSFLNKLMAMNIRLKGANLIQIKVDKMSSANGLLALAPLFSRRTIEAAMACPPWLKLEGNVEKAVLKKAVRDIVPDAIIQRPKCGMMVPVKFWFQGEMRRYAHKVLSKKNLRRIGLFNAEYVRRLLKYDLTDLRGQRYGTKLWMLITFMLWYEQMIESVPQPPRHPAGAAAPSVSFLGRWRQGKQSTAGMASSHTHEETVA